jgi:hypothetical protein
MGAFEYAPPAPPSGGDPGGGGADPGGDPGGGAADPGGGTTPPAANEVPRILKLKFRRDLSESDGGTMKATLSEAASVKVSFRSARDRGRVRFSGIGGRNRVRIRPGKLDEGTYRVKAIATDADGARSAPLRTRAVVGD